MARRARMSVNDRPPKWKMFLRRQRKLLRPAAWCCAGLACAAAGLVLLRSAGPGSGIAAIRERIGAVTADAGMRIREIQIKGQPATPQPRILAALGVREGAPIIGFSLEQARKNIESIPRVAHATVERLLPDTLVVTIAERRPFAVWQLHDEFFLIDRDGKTVTDEDRSQFQQLPLIVGARAPETATTLLDALTERPAIQRYVAAAIRIGGRRWNLRLRNGGDVLLPEGHEIAALDRLLVLQRDNALLDRPLAAIDMRLPDKLVIRAQGTQRADPGQDEKPVPPPPPPAPKKPT